MILKEMIYTKSAESSTKQKISMSRKGDCWDNAVSESFFRLLKTELVHHKRFKTRAEANQAIFEYIEVFYNRQRLHSTNDYMFLVNYELKMLEYQTAA